MMQRLDHDVLEGPMEWEHIAGEGCPPRSTYRLEVPGGWVYVVEGASTATCFVPGTGSTQARPILLAQLGMRSPRDVIEAEPEEGAVHSGPAPFSGERSAKAPTPPLCLLDTQLREAFGVALVRRLASRPPALDDWYALDQLLARQPPYRPPLWEAFGLSAEHEDAMLQAAAQVLDGLGYTIERGRVYAPRDRRAPQRAP